MNREGEAVYPRSAYCYPKRGLFRGPFALCDQYRINTNRRAADRQFPPRCLKISCTYRYFLNVCSISNMNKRRLNHYVILQVPSSSSTNRHLLKYTSVNCYSSVNLSKYLHSWRLYSTGGGVYLAEQTLRLSNDIFFSCFYLLTPPPFQNVTSCFLSLSNQRADLHKVSFDATTVTWWGWCDNTSRQSNQTNNQKVSVFNAAPHWSALKQGT